MRRVDYVIAVYDVSNYLAKYKTWDSWGIYTSFLFSDQTCNDRGIVFLNVLYNIDDRRDPIDDRHDQDDRDKWLVVINTKVKWNLNQFMESWHHGNTVGNYWKLCAQAGWRQSQRKEKPDEKC